MNYYDQCLTFHIDGHNVGKPMKVITAGYI